MKCNILVFPNAPNGPRCVAEYGHASGQHVMPACPNPGCSSYSDHTGTCAPNESARAIQTRLLLDLWDKGDIASHEFDAKLREIANES